MINFLKAFMNEYEVHGISLFDYRSGNDSNEQKASSSPEISGRQPDKHAPPDNISNFKRRLPPGFAYFRDGAIYAA